MSLTFTAKDDSAFLHHLVQLFHLQKNGLLGDKFAAKSDLMRFSQLANISRLHFHFHDNWEFRPHSPSTFLPVNSFLSVHNVGQHRDHQPIRISSRQSTWFFQQDLQSFWNVLHNWYWYRVIICLTNFNCYPAPMRRSLVGEYFKIFSICWRPSLPVCPVHCGLTRLQGPRGRRMEERRRRSRRPR